jgi:hypothetical protein
VVFKLSVLQPAEKVGVALVLGGAAVHRCGNCIVLNTALAAEGTILARIDFFRKLQG